MSGKLGVPVATCFPTMDHAQLSQLAPYNIQVDTSIAGSNNGTIGIERRSEGPAVKAGWQAGAEGLPECNPQSICYGISKDGHIRPHATGRTPNALDSASPAPRV